jgi:iron donor protein CyaY
LTIHACAKLGPVDDQEFRLRADEALQDLDRRLAKASSDYPIDADMSAGALVIEFEDPPTKFVVSPNSPVHQVWVSALLKSFKLDWQAERNAFVLPGTGQSLLELMASLIEQHMGEAVPL